MSRSIFPVTLGVTACGLAVLIAAAVWQYGGNVSALLHMDVPFAEEHDVPPGIVLYTTGAYDGMLYYQIARDLPALFLGGDPSLDSPYRFQRVLLPVVAYALSFGREGAFPAAILAINVAAALGTLALLLSLTKKTNVHVLSGVLNPGMLVGILYALTEPLSMFFVALFLLVFERSGRRMTGAGIAALLLSLLARETTVFLMFPLGLWFLWKKEWKNACLLIVPVLLFIAWQYFLVLRLGSLPFRGPNHILTWPFVGPVTLLHWAVIHTGRHQLIHFASLALLSFLLPLGGLLAGEWYRKRRHIALMPFLLSALGVTMLCMDPHIWGAITSIGRVVTPVYPVYALYAAGHDTKVMRLLSGLLISVGIITAIGIAFIGHPYVLS